MKIKANSTGLTSKHVITSCYESNDQKIHNGSHHAKSLDLYLEFRDKGSSRVWWTVFSLLMVATLATRFYRLDKPSHVCWDEAHFGKYAGHYINRTFFFDVHPPLGKMLIGLFGYLDGYNATFPFDKPGDSYQDYPFMGMRGGCALMGALLVPLTFLTVWEMTFSLPAATLGGLLNLLDHGMLTLNRYILLDPPMLFFISASVYTMVKFHNQRHRPFSVAWWIWLFSVGLMLAGSIAVKFVGVFVVFLVGFRAVTDLWEILGDMSKPVSYTVKHFMARAVGLIAFPAVIYVAIFYVHLSILNLSGPGDGFYSSAFQTSLKNNYLYNASTPKEVAYGAVLSLKNAITSGGYLHSHYHLYPVDSTGQSQQQITTYTHKDHNNHWHIKRYNRLPPSWNSTKPIDYVRNGDLIRLEHLDTGRNLHSHAVTAPLTYKHYQVTGYGDEGVGDVNDIWRLEIVDGEENQILETMRHRFRLIHYNLDCVLTCTKKQLPKWGFEQDEVTCNPNIRDPNAVWNVEDNQFPRLPNVSFRSYELNFFQRFLESHYVMITGNAGLKPKEGEMTSKPWMWPINLRGQFFSTGVTEIYLLGNPIIWFGNLGFMVLYFVLWAICGIRQKRRISTSPRQIMLQKRALEPCWWLFIGWLLHYLPFWGMGRILYFHHYFPAVLFASMLTGILLDYLIETVPTLVPRKYSKMSYMAAFGSVVALLLFSFYLFAPLTYGVTRDLTKLPSGMIPNSTMHHLRWLNTWEF